MTVMLKRSGVNYSLAHPRSTPGKHSRWQVLAIDNVPDGVTWLQIALQLNRVILVGNPTRIDYSAIADKPQGSIIR